MEKRPRGRPVSKPHWYDIEIGEDSAGNLVCQAAGSSVLNVVDSWTEEILGDCTPPKLFLIARHWRNSMKDADGKVIPYYDSFILGRSIDLENSFAQICTVDDHRVVMIKKLLEPVMWSSEKIADVICRHNKKAFDRLKDLECNNSRDVEHARSVLFLESKMANYPVGYDLMEDAKWSVTSQAVMKAMKIIWSYNEQNL